MLVGDDALSSLVTTLRPPLVSTLPEPADDDAFGPVTSSPRSSSLRRSSPHRSSPRSSSLHRSSPRSSSRRSSSPRSSFRRQHVRVSRQQPSAVLLPQYRQRMSRALRRGAAGRGHRDREPGPHVRPVAKDVDLLDL